MRILLVEDDKLLGDGIVAGLRLDGYATDWIRRGDQVASALLAEEYDLMILDLGLPGMDGLDALRELRARHNHVPVLILTARDAVDERVKGLDQGADDYMAKPFDLEELAARARALIRRSRGHTSPLLTHGELTVDPANHTVTLRGEAVDVAPKEFAILHTLITSQNKVVSKNRLEQSLYDWDRNVGSNTVEVYIHNLRKKLGNDFIRTIRGVGYALNHPSGGSQTGDAEPDT